MDGVGGTILIFLFFLYPYWMAPALVLLNWQLARRLAARLAPAPLVAANLAVSLLLLGPIGERGGNIVFMGDFYYPWYLGGFALHADKVWWPGVLIVCALSVATSVATLRRRGRRA